MLYLLVNLCLWISVNDGPSWDSWTLFMGSHQARGPALFVLARQFFSISWVNFVFVCDFVFVDNCEWWPSTSPGVSRQRTSFLYLFNRFCICFCICGYVWMMAHLGTTTPSPKGVTRQRNPVCLYLFINSVYIIFRWRRQATRASRLPRAMPTAFNEPPLCKTRKI